MNCRMKYLLENLNYHNTLMRSIILIVLAFFTLSVCAQNIPERTSPPKLVNDFANILEADQIQQLENALVKFENETSTQVAVVTVKSLDGDDVSNYAFRLGEKWGIGQKGKNNGILILIKPKYGNERGQAFIATGYGLEGAVPDAYAKRIVENEMIPNFKQNDYFKGIASAVTVIMQLTKGEYTAEQYAKQKSKGSFLPIIFIIVIAIIFMVISNKAKSSTKNYNRNGSDLPFWLLLGGMAASSSSRSHNDSWGSFSSGSGWFGGFGG